LRRSPFSGTSTPDLRILTWNLFHGRAVPAAGRDLSAQFAGLLRGWEWDVALLQEVPPWWPARLARAAGAEQRTALTSRNSGLWLRRQLAERWPDTIKSNGGGSNAILARRPIVEHHTLRLRHWPERRVAQLARLEDGSCVVNYHASARVELAEAELRCLWDEALKWAGESPLILGGDLNLRNPAAPLGDVVNLARRDVDHIFTLGLRSAGEPKLLDRHLTLAGERTELSDHVPLLAAAEPG
jgi:endonuclease/exonuclease/phosphatase family metal-dependent hydrolase